MYYTQFETGDSRMKPTKIIFLELETLIPHADWCDEEIDEALVIKQFQLNLEKLISIERHEDIDHNIKFFIVGKWIKFLELKNDIVKRSYEHYTEFERQIIELMISYLSSYIVGIGSNNNQKDIEVLQYFEGVKSLVIGNTFTGKDIYKHKCMRINENIFTYQMCDIVNYFKD